MLEAYSLNVTVPANTSVPFNNVTLHKGCTAVLTSPTSIQLNQKGVYVITCDGSSAATTTIQLFKDNVAQPQAQSTGISPSFTTYVQVDRNNNPNCCCDSPVTVRIVNPTATAATFSNINICVSKLC